MSTDLSRWGKMCTGARNRKQRRRVWQKYLSTNLKNNQQISYQIISALLLTRQNKTTEDVTLDFWGNLMDFLSVLWCFFNFFILEAKLPFVSHLTASLCYSKVTVNHSLLGIIVLFLMSVTVTDWRAVLVSVILKTFKLKLVKSSVYLKSPSHTSLTKEARVGRC